MCDEYDEERMRLFWRQLAVQEEHADLDEKLEPALESLGRPADDVAQVVRPKPRVLTR
jgi:hypothetical protein